jgi:hypothetical protein
MHAMCTHACMHDVWCWLLFVARVLTACHAAQLTHLRLRGGIRQNLYFYYFEKLHAPRARGARARARAAREGRRDESTVNNSGSKLKIYETHPVGNLLLFRSRGRATRESTYAWRKVGNNNDPITPHLLAYPPCTAVDLRATPCQKHVNVKCVLNLLFSTTFKRGSAPAGGIFGG